MFTAMRRFSRIRRSWRTRSRLARRSFAQSRAAPGCAAASAPLIFVIPHPTHGGEDRLIGYCFSSARAVSTRAMSGSVQIGKESFFPRSDVEARGHAFS
jgi:hypothetical protein